jgi:phosphosulfolactate synthase (CoM biosynthesis protein A)
MVESEGITENVPEWREDIIYKIASSFDLRHLMFEAADPEVYAWYIKNLGPEVNLFVDSTQILGLEAARTGTWGRSITWGRVASFYRK